MTETVAGWIVGLVGLYAGIGVLFAIPFVLVGAAKIDPSVAKTTWAFRLLILPGSAAFWPLLAKRWFGGVTEPPDERNAHRDAATRRGS